jgi:hypothetical protein
LGHRRRQIRFKHPCHSGSPALTDKEKDASPYPVTRKIGAILEKYKIAYWAIQVWQNDGLSYPLFKDAYLE